MSEVTSFDGIAEEFYDYSQRTRGGVRYQLVHENLAPYVANPDVQTVLDVCGGSGIDAAWFASNGLRVTIVEPSKDQLAMARTQFEALDFDSRRRIAAPLTMDFMNYKTERLFDMVAMHGVSMYQKDPITQIKKAVSHLRLGGTFSVLEKGWGAAAQRVIDSGDQKAIQYFNESGKFVNRRGLEVTAFTVEELQETIESLGCTVVASFGVRVVSDHINERIEDYGKRNFEMLLDIERTASKDPHCIGMAQMVQLIATKD